MAEYEVPKRCIENEEQLHKFSSGRTCKELLEFIEDLAVRCADKETVGLAALEEPTENVSPEVLKVISLLSHINKFVEKCPPAKQPMRFGNTAFRDWVALLKQDGEEILSKIFEERPEFLASVPELLPYLMDSFGNAQRVDYGTGHEAAFCAFLYCLCKIGFFSEQDRDQIVVTVFAAYMEVMRGVQSAYMLEPAGSHGVWGLDDYHHLPFLFGAGQLAGFDSADYAEKKGFVQVSPMQIDSEEVLKLNARFMYVDAVKWVLTNKVGAPFHETSPVLHSIKGVGTWEKVRKGLLKMYAAEVLGKKPVIQHFLFGSILKYE